MGMNIGSDSQDPENFAEHAKPVRLADLLALAFSYLYWIRPVLRSLPTFAAFYAQTDSFWLALRLRFAGIKGKLVVAASMAAADHRRARLRARQHHRHRLDAGART